MVKKVKLDKGPTFKKSNKKQFHFNNEEVREKLATAFAAINTIPSSTPTEKTKEAPKGR